MNRERARVLAVDDEPRYTWAIRSILQGVGYEVLVATNGRAAVELAAMESPDLILLDIRMPDISGVEVCRQVRQFSTVPIIMLTALAEDADKVRGLDAGADDYITKPFGAEELLARVRALLRRAAMVEMRGHDGIVRVGDLEINLLKRRVTIAGVEAELSATEYEVLAQLADPPGRVCLPDDLLEAVWGVESVGDLHLLRQVIYRLRQKLEPDPGNPSYVINRPGVGYLLADGDPA